MCHCSKWEHIAHYTPKNQNTAKTNFRERARARTHTHATRLVFQQDPCCIAPSNSDGKERSVLERLSHYSKRQKYSLVA